MRRLPNSTVLSLIIAGVAALFLLGILRSLPSGHLVGQISSCMLEGQVCATSGDCCSGMTCDSGFCTPSLCSCHHFDYSVEVCAQYTPPCLHNASTGGCDGTLPFAPFTGEACTPACVNDGGSCTSDSMCCSGLSCHGGGMPTPSCGALGADCDTNGDCCSSLVCNVNDHCIPDPLLCTGGACGSDCGNLVLDSGEVCDSAIAGCLNGAVVGSCRYDCSRCMICGDTIVDPLIGEQCDDGGTVSGDGCSPTCLLEATAGTCGPDACVAVGNSCTSDSQCCDGNTCEIILPPPPPPPPGPLCALENGACSVIGDCCGGLECFLGQCVPIDPSLGICGNGIFESENNENCDDGNFADGDGCSFCRCEPGYDCGQDFPVLRCGNTVLQPEFGETCDDGNRINGDGCSSVCIIETSVKICRPSPPVLGCLEVFKSAIDSADVSISPPTTYFHLWTTGPPAVETAQMQNNAAGKARFDALVPGTYIVKEDILSGWTPVGSVSKTVTVVPGAACAVLNFVNKQDPLTPAFHVSITGAPLTPVLGAGLTYTVKIWNTGFAGVTPLTVTLPSTVPSIDPILPVPLPPDLNYEAGPRTLKWTGIAIPAGAIPVIRQFDVTVSTSAPDSFTTAADVIGATDAYTTAVLRPGSSSSSSLPSSSSSSSPLSSSSSSRSSSSSPSASSSSNSSYSSHSSYSSPSSSPSSSSSSPSQPLFFIDKTDNRKSTPPQSHLSYVIRVSNLSGSPVNALHPLTVIDALPPELKPGSVTGEVFSLPPVAGGTSFAGTVDSTAHTVTWVITSLPPGAAAILSLEADVRSDAVAGTFIRNKAWTVYDDVSGLSAVDITRVDPPQSSHYGDICIIDHYIDVDGNELEWQPKTVFYLDTNVEDVTMTVGDAHVTTFHVPVGLHTVSEVPPFATASDGWALAYVQGLDDDGTLNVVEGECAKITFVNTEFHVPKTCPDKICEFWLEGKEAETCNNCRSDCGVCPLSSSSSSHSSVLPHSSSSSSSLSSSHPSSSDSSSFSNSSHSFSSASPSSSSPSSSSAPLKDLWCTNFMVFPPFCPVYNPAIHPLKDGTVMFAPPYIPTAGMSPTAMRDPIDCRLVCDFIKTTGLCWDRNLGCVVGEYQNCEGMFFPYPDPYVEPLACSPFCPRGFCLGPP